MVCTYASTHVLGKHYLGIHCVADAMTGHEISLGANQGYSIINWQAADNQDFKCIVCH